MSADTLRPVKDTGMLIKRRQLLYTALLGSVAFLGLASIFALARSPGPPHLKRGDRMCTEVLDLKRVTCKSNELIKGTVLLHFSGQERIIDFYMLQGPFEDALVPSIVIDRAEGRVFAYATDLEWLSYITQKRNDIEIFDEVVERAEREGKRRVARYVKIIKEIVVSSGRVEAV
jgi:hypothetical protein